MANAKTTVELPPHLLAQAKVLAAMRKTSLRKVIEEALEAHIKAASKQAEPSWMACFGTLADISTEVERVQGVIDEEFSTVNLEDWR
jgi:hypothetical protein